MITLFIIVYIAIGILVYGLAFAVQHKGWSKSIQKKYLNKDIRLSLAVAALWPVGIIALWIFCSIKPDKGFKGFQWRVHHE